MYLNIYTPLTIKTIKLSNYKVVKLNTFKKDDFSHKIMKALQKYVMQAQQLISIRSHYEQRKAGDTHPLYAGKSSILRAYAANLETTSKRLRDGQLTLEDQLTERFNAKNYQTHSTPYGIVVPFPESLNVKAYSFQHFELYGSSIAVLDATETCPPLALVYELSGSILSESLEDASAFLHAHHYPTLQKEYRKAHSIMKALYFGEKRAELEDIEALHLITMRYFLVGNLAARAQKKKLESDDILEIAENLHALDKLSFEQLATFMDSRMYTKDAQRTSMLDISAQVVRFFCAAHYLIQHYEKDSAVTVLAQIPYKHFELFNSIKNDPSNEEFETQCIALLGSGERTAHNPSERLPSELEARLLKIVDQSEDRDKLEN